MQINKSSRVGVVFTCAHASPEVSNERFDWLGKFIYDIRPDYVIDLGDGADMKSLNSYDTLKPKAVVAQNYEKDIECYNDSQERLRSMFKTHRRRRPKWYGFEGNHEHRIKTALTFDPRLEGSKYGISFSHLNTNKWFDEYHEYIHSAPSICDYDGVSYAHYITSGNSPAAVSGVHHAYGLVQKRYNSTTVGHSHKRGIHFKDDAHPSPAIGLVAGCYKGAPEGWAGQSNLGWWKGVVIKRDISNGLYEPQFVSLATLEREYGGV